MSRAPILIGLCYLLTSCVTVEIEGETSKAQKERFLKSYLVQNAELFYPGGYVASTAQPFPNLSSGDRKKIEKQVRALASFVATEHNQRHGELSELLGKPLSPRASRRAVRVLPDTRPVARMTSNGEAQFSLVVLQALFRGAVLEGVLHRRDDDTFSLGNSDVLPFDDRLQPSSATLEQEQGIEELLADIERAREVKARGALGEVISAFSDDEDFDEDPWFIMSDITSRSDALQISHVGAVLFLLAHEQGHFVLGHPAQLDAVAHDTNAYCMTSQRHELEADAYALLLLSPYLKDGLPPSLDFMNFGALTGYRSFLQYSYSLSGFNADVHCPYPSNAERFEALRSVDQEIRTAADSNFNRSLEAALEAMLESQN